MEWEKQHLQKILAGEEEANKGRVEIKVKIAYKPNILFQTLKAQ